MYKRCPTEKGAAQQQILEGKLFALMQEIPYAEISVRRLCEDAGISRKTFYRLYENKDDVLMALIDRTYRNYLHFEMPKAQMVPGISENLQTFFWYWKERCFLLDVLKANHKSSLMIERSVAHVQNEESAILHAIGAEKPFSSREKTLFFVSGCMSLVVDWHETGYRKSVAEMAEIFYELLTTPPVSPALFSNE